jgi:hypothetical protein
MKETVAVGDRVDSVPCGRTAPVHPVVFVTVAQHRDRRPCHARPDSRMTSHRTYKAGYRDAHYLWSGYFLSLACGSHRPRRSHRLVPQHRRRHRCPGQLLPCPCGGTGSHGSHGGYEQQPFALLWEQGLPVTLLNPRAVRRFAEGMGLLEKTDSLDAGVIAWFAEVKRSQPQSLSSASRQQLRALVTRLCQLTAIRTAQRNQSRLVTAPAVLASLPSCWPWWPARSASLKSPSPR